MALLHYEMLDFREEEDKVRVSLSKRFYVSIPNQELTAIAPFKVNQTGIEFDCSQQRAQTRFLNIFGTHLPELHSLVTNNPAVYIHQKSGIPLMGNLSFGIIHRGTSIIEVKPQTSCNLDCVYCSVNEGLSSNQTDYLVEREYLVNEFIKVAEFLNTSVEAHIGVQGEPLLYSEFAELASDFSKLDYVHRITTDTNGTILTKPLIDKLSKIPKLRLNISLNAVDKAIASKMAGAPYNTTPVVGWAGVAAEKMATFVAS